MTIFKQGDYPNDYLGKSKISIAKSGCLTCDITVGVNSLKGTAYNPVDISKKLAYIDGILQWASLANIGLKLIYKSTTRNDNAVGEALSNPDRFAVLEINHGAHFVLVIGRKLPVLGFRVYDSFYGDKAYRYNSVVTGCRIVANL